MQEPLLHGCGTCQHPLAVPVASTSASQFRYHAATLRPAGKRTHTIQMIAGPTNPGAWVGGWVGGWGDTGIAGVTRRQAGPVPQYQSRLGVWSTPP